MTKQMMEIQNQLNNIDDIRDKLGGTIYDCIEEDGSNFTCDMGRCILNTILNCDTQRELDIANNILMAISGYSLESILEKILERDKEGYIWESII